MIDDNPVSVRNELRAFARHLDEVCGLAPATRLQRIKVTRGFLVDRFGSAPIRLSQLTPGDIHRFVHDTFGGCKPSTANVLCGILRSYFRFRSMRGDETRGLIAAVPRAACWRLAALPQAPTEEQIDAFLGAFDRTSASGRRNYAMARCLVDLGLRAGEVAQLQLDDMDWRHGTLRIAANKSRRIDLLPLPARTGQAIVQYLRAGRPATASRALFVRHVAPLDAPIGLDIVRAAMRGAYVRCGWAYSDGTHVLRHSTASRLLRAGTPLKQIADILRHRSVDTTVIYTKVDLEKLAMIAMPWPGSRS